MATDVKVPALGESITEGTLAQWLKKAGEAVGRAQPILEHHRDPRTIVVAGAIGEDGAAVPGDRWAGTPGSPGMVHGRVP